MNGEKKNIGPIVKRTKTNMFIIDSCTRKIRLNRGPVEKIYPKESSPTRARSIYRIFNSLIISSSATETIIINRFSFWKIVTIRNDNNRSLNFF